MINKAIKLILLLCISCGLLASCSSTENKTKITELEQTILELKKQLPESPDEEKEEVLYQEVTILLPKITKTKVNEAKKKIPLGEKDGFDVNFVFNNGQYWVHLDHKNKSALDEVLEYGELTLLIQDKSQENMPENLTLVAFDENSFMGLGDRQKGSTRFILNIKKNRNKQDEPLTFIFDITLR